MPVFNDDEDARFETEEVEEGGGETTTSAGESTSSKLPGSLPSGGSSKGGTPKEKLLQAAKNVANKNLEERESLQKVNEAKERLRKLQENYKRGQHAAAVAKSGASAFVATVMDPIFWLILLAFVLIVLLISVAQTVGKNENAKGCGGNTGDQTSFVAGGPYDKQKNMNNLGSYLMATSFQFNGGKPLSKEQAAGMIGNWMEESGLDPAITQGGRPGQPNSGWCPNCNNEAILANGGSAGSKAVGLAQWDRSRRQALVNFAQGKGKQWNDLAVQVEYLKSELDGGEGKALASSDFVTPGLSAERYAEIFNRVFERSADFSPQRAQHAQEVMSTMAGGAGIDVGGDSTTGGSCTMQDGNFDNSGVVKLAISLAYPLEQKQSSFTTPGDGDGCSVATPAYKAAKEAAQKAGGEDAYSEGGPCRELYASCDRFVATVLKLTVDPEVPWGSSDTQYDYFAKHPEKWQPFHKKSEAKPGAVFTTRGHILLYVGQVNGKDSIAQASHRQYVARIDNASQITEDLKDTYMGRPYIGYNFIGPGGSGAAATAVTAAS